MGVWDAMGQGVQAGVNAWLENQRRKQEGAQNQALIEMRQKELGLNQARDWEELQLTKDAQARAEQEKLQAEHLSYDKLLSRPDLNILIPNYRDFGNGAYVPLTPEEKMFELQRQKEQYESERKRLAEEEYGYEKQLAQIRSAGAEKPKVDQRALLAQLYLGKPGSRVRNDPVAQSLLEGIIQTSIPEALIAAQGFDPYSLVQGAEGAERAKRAASRIATAADSLYPDKSFQQIYEDMVGLLVQWNPNLSSLVSPQQTAPPVGTRTAPQPDWTGYVKPKLPAFTATPEQVQLATPLIQANQATLDPWKDQEMMNDINTWSEQRGGGGTRFIRASDVDKIAQRYQVPRERVLKNLVNITVVEGK